MKLIGWVDILTSSSKPRNPSEPGPTFMWTWLTDTPRGLGEIEQFVCLEYHIKDLISHGIMPEDLGDGFKKIMLNDLEYYWLEKNGEIMIASELRNFYFACAVRMLSHNFRQSEYLSLSDFYTLMIQEVYVPVRVDATEETYKIAKNLLSNGCSISAYDSSNPLEFCQPFSSEKEIDAFWNFYYCEQDRFRFVFDNTRSSRICEWVQRIKSNPIELATDFYLQGSGFRYFDRCNGRLYE